LLTLADESPAGRSVLRSGGPRPERAEMLKC
jgi:hypothetical protein